MDAEERDQCTRDIQALLKLTGAGIDKIAKKYNINQMYLLDIYIDSVIKITEDMRKKGF